MPDPQAPWIQSGPHRYQVVGDVIYYEAHGKMALKEAAELLERCHLVYEQHGFIYTILDAREVEMADAEVRKMFADKQKLRDTQGITFIVGANRVIRSFAILWQNVVRLMGRPLGLVRFAASEAEAWQEVAKHREERRAASSAQL